MTQYTKNSKSILARALAQENITVEHHPSAVTAMFDVANRVLVLPAWEDMSDELRDMFIGHEVGHALYTPYREKDKASDTPWIPEAEIIGGTVHAGYVQGIFNIVEDVRIEKMIKDKYPGLRRDFAAGYRELTNKDFFGTEDKDLKDFSFGDRINIHFKCGAMFNVPFSSEEMVLVGKVDSCETFEDMIQCGKEIYEFIGGKNESVNKEPKPMQPVPTQVQFSPDDQDCNNATSSGVSVDQKSNLEISQASMGSQPTNAEAEADSNKKSEFNGTNGAGIGLAPDKLPVMTTQGNFDRKIKDLSKSTISSIRYATLPTPNISRIVLPFAKTHDKITNHFSVHSKMNAHYVELFKRINTKFDDLVRSTTPMISTLIKQFEMRKAADVQKRTSISKSGRIDCDRIFKYLVSDDIFSRFERIADGKNHGLVMYVDWSSSMQVATDDVLIQIIILSRFCKQMGIPFDVYLFSSQYHVLDSHLGLESKKYDSTNDDYEIGTAKERPSQWSDPSTSKLFTRWGSNKEYDAKLPDDSFALIQILSSDMNGKQFNDALRNVYSIGQLVTHQPELTKNIAVSCCTCVPMGFHQGNTPLDSTILAAMKMVPAFQEKHRVQIVNTIFLTDGDTGYSPLFEHSYAHKTYVICPFNKKEYVFMEETSTNFLLGMFRDVTQSTTIGFYIQTSRNNSRYLLNKKEDAKKLKDDGFLDVPSTKKVESSRSTWNGSSYVSNYIEQKIHGYDRMFVLPANQEIVDSFDALDNLSNTATLGSIRSTFLKVAEKRNSSRSFLNRFADVISVPTKR